MKYKVGDRVLIRSLDEFASGAIPSENINHNEKAIGLYGQEVTIAYVGKNHYEIREDYGRNSWDDSMIKGRIQDLTTKEIKEIAIQKFWQNHGIGGVLKEHRIISDPQRRNSELCYQDNEHTIRKHLTGALENDGDIALVSLIDEEAGIMTARYYEKLSIKDTGYGVTVKEIRRIGPCEYFYPDGSTAAVEMYHDKNDKTHDNKFPTAGLYFDPEGDQTTRSMFDVFYRKEHGYELPMEFAPRIKEYIALVDDLRMEYVFGTDRFDAQDIRELWVAGTPLMYQDMLAEDIKQACKEHVALGQISENSIDRQNNFFVYGIFTPQPTIYFDDELLEALGFDMSKPDVHEYVDTIPISESPEQHPGMAVEELPGMQHPSLRSVNVTRTVYTSQQFPNLQYVIDTLDGKVMMKMLMNDKVEERSVRFYPDGSVNMTSVKEPWPIQRQFDSYGKLCTFDIADQCFYSEWGYPVPYVGVKKGHDVCSNGGTRITFGSHSLQDEYLKIKIDTEGGNVRLMNAYETGFDSRIFRMEVDGKKVNIADCMELSAGQHEVRLYMDRKKKIRIPENLFKNCKDITSVTVNQMDRNRFINLSDKLFETCPKTYEYKQMQEKKKQQQTKPKKRNIFRR